MTNDSRPWESDYIELCLLSTVEWGYKMGSRASDGGAQPLW